MRELSVKEIEQVNGGSFWRFALKALVQIAGHGGPDRYTGGFHG